MKIHNIDIAREMLTSGKIVAIPTETVYGLAALINDQDALHSIFIVKERPFFDPLIVHVSGINQAKKLSNSWDPVSESLADYFWPGPLTLILPKNNVRVSDLITSGLSTVGLRCPNHPLTLELLKSLPCALAAPSANKFTKTSPTNADHVIKNFDNEVTVLEGEFCDVGLESTIAQVDPNSKSVKILRAGMITQSQIEEIIPKSYKVIFVENAQVPGSMKKHYAPDAPFYYIKENENLIEKVISEHVSLDKQELILSDKPQLAAREIYSKLQLLDPKIVHFFRQRSVHEDVSWIAILDRIKRAANN